MRRKASLAFPLVLLLAAPLHAADYYVRAGGSDGAGALAIPGPAGLVSTVILGPAAGACGALEWNTPEAPRPLPGARLPSTGAEKEDPWAPVPSRSPPRRRMIYEHRSAPLLTRARYARRVLRHAAASAGLVGASLVGGTLGYHHFAGKAWIDAFLNASMLLGGMGPVGELDTDAGKLFASFYALYAGLVFVVAGGIVIAPTLHRILHALHFDQDDDRPPAPPRS